MHKQAPTSDSESARSPENVESHVVELNDVSITSFQHIQDLRSVFEDRFITLEVRDGLRDIGECIQKTLQHLQS